MYVNGGCLYITYQENKFSFYDSQYDAEAE